jgi:acetyl-CoA carboxylase carboxyltransferase component
MGGSEAIAKQHERGRLTIRERISALADADSFREQGPMAGHAELDESGALRSFTPANYVLGLARVDGRPVVVGGEDFTVRGGSPTPAGLRKSVYAEDLAIRRRLPLVRLLEGGGGSVTGTRGKGRKTGPTPPGDAPFANPRFESIARVLELVPVASAALGAVAGFPAARLAASHFSVMTRNTSQVLIGGPALVERALGEKLTKEELGGVRVHLRRWRWYGASCRTCRTTSSSNRPRRPVTTTRNAASRRCSSSCRATAAASTTCASCWVAS